MSLIVPAIIPKSREELEVRLSEVVGVSRRVQIDIVDGIFAQPASWPYLTALTEVGEANMLPLYDQFEFEIDAMVSDAVSALDAFLSAGASRFIFHVESQKDVDAFLRHCCDHHGYDRAFQTDLISIGVALNLDTDPKVIRPLIEKVDFVQVMGISTIGEQGHAFDERALTHIQKIRSFDRHIPVQVDGGINRATAERALNVGATHLIVGSAVWKAEDPKQLIEELEELSSRYGIYE